VIVNQARMLAYLREYMERSASRLTPFYGVQASDVAVDADGVTVTTQAGTIRARYVVGCDGARSAVRAAIGRELVGDATNEVWGVMDVLAVTDFPDIRLKAAISSRAGNILIIPREGGYLVRFYIELEDKRDVTPQTLAAVANRILHPYSVEVKDVGWWSVYEIGQRLCESFDDATGSAAPRVFIAGDACHTHSAKAGQGMNVSMADAWNLGWKLAAVLRGTAKPELLRTYSQERRAVARELIDFDREFSRLFRSGKAVDPARFQRYFIAQGRFTAGVATRYAPSPITAEATHQHLAEGFPVGMRFHSAPVIRLADAKPVQLGHVARADGAWRVYLFAGADAGLPVPDLGRFTPADAEPDSVIDVRAVFQQGHRDLRLEDMPAALLPRKGIFGLIDYEKIFCADPAADIFDERGIDRERGCMIVARPDHYVAAVLPLDAHDTLMDFFAPILVDAYVHEGVADRS
jgi:phenol 2-monooxygenase